MAQLLTIVGWTFFQYLEATPAISAGSGYRGQSGQGAWGYANPNYVMPKSSRKSTNEPEFQGQVIVWLNEEITKRSALDLDKATQEKPQELSRKRSDLIVWTNRLAEIAFLAIELKTPETPINDPIFFTDAINKAQYWGAKYLAIWNMREMEVYKTPDDSKPLLPSEAIYRSALPLAITEVEDWLKPAYETELRNQSVNLLDAAVLHSAYGSYLGQTIDAQIFVSRLTNTISKLRAIFFRDLTKACGTNRKLRVQVNRIAAEHGFLGFVDDVNYAIAGQIGYRLIGQILFYFALRRKIPELNPITLMEGDELPDALRPYWNDVRRYDYEALFKPDPIEELITIGDAPQALVRQLVEQLGAYDWASLTDDVLGSIFEHLIPREEQVLLGQFYTPRPVADLLVAFTVDGERPLVLDPGCGSGTFLMAVYGYLQHAANLSHADLLSLIWGVDISPFAAELAVINLFRQDMSEYENFPRIVPGNFFERLPGETIDFPAPIASSGTQKVPVPIPVFDCVIGNPPYLRSQNQDDLDKNYRDMLFSSAARAGIQASAKTDLFAFFIYHALRFMREGSRLGFVTPASWLTADYARSLQELLLGQIRLSAVIASSAESFFPQVDINTVLLVAEKVRQDSERHPIRFVTLKKSIAELASAEGGYWPRVIRLVSQIETANESQEDDRYRIKLVDPVAEKEALTHDPAPRNWSKFLRAPLSYYEIFEASP